MQQGQLNEGDYDRERFEERVWRLARERDIGRRRVLELVGLAGAGSVLASCGWSAAQRQQEQPPANSTTTTGASAAPSPWVKPIPEDKFIIHKTNAEMRWEQMRGRGYTTPNDLFFVRNTPKRPGLTEVAGGCGCREAVSPVPSTSATTSWGS